MSKSGFLASRLKAPSLILGLALVSSVSLVGSGPAWAVISLTSSQTSAMQDALSAALSAAKGDPMAIEAAIAAAVQNAVTTYGDDAAASITSLVITVAEGAGIPASEIGAALAQASAALSAAGHSAAAGSIASTLANEGNADEIVAYQDAATELGYSNLASIAGQPPSATGETGNANNNNSNSGSGLNGGTAGGGGGCLNPSCTKL